MAGRILQDDWTMAVMEMTGLKDVEISSLNDTATGLVRIALHRDGALQALFFASPTPVVLARALAVAHIGTDTAPLAALAGRAGADQPDPGPTVCACFNVGRNTLLQAVDSGAQSVDALGELTSAGTNCGSCKPELAALIAPFKLPMAAE